MTERGVVTMEDFAIGCTARQYEAASVHAERAKQAYKMASEASTHASECAVDGELEEARGWAETAQSCAERASAHWHAAVSLAPNTRPAAEAMTHHQSARMVAKHADLASRRD